MSQCGWWFVAGMSWHLVFDVATGILLFLAGDRWGGAARRLLGRLHRLGHRHG